MEPRIGIGHNHPPTEATLPIPIDDKDLKAAKRAAKELPPNFSADQAEDDVKERVATCRQVKRKARAALRDALKALFKMYIRMAVNQEDALKLKSACDQENIDLRRADLALSVIKYHWRDLQPEAANRYANVLREAACLDVPADELSTYLSDPDHGVNSLHKAFKERKKNRKNGHPSQQTPQRREEPKVRVNWPTKKLTAFRSAKLGSRLTIRVKKIGDDTARVLNCVRSSRNKASGSSNRN